MITRYTETFGSPAVGTPPLGKSQKPLPSPSPGPALSRYVVERCPGGGDRVEVLDLARKPLKRVVARTSWADAHMIANALGPLREASENVLIAWGMGWDMKGVIEELKKSLTKCA